MRVYFLLHPFLAQLLDYFDIVPFQLPPNSHHFIVTSYIIFSEYCGVAPSVVQFIYIYGLKAIAKHVGFWYLTYRSNFAGITGSSRNSGPVEIQILFLPLKVLQGVESGL